MGLKDRVFGGEVATSPSDQIVFVSSIRRHARASEPQPARHSENLDTSEALDYE